MSEAEALVLDRSLRMSRAGDRAGTRLAAGGDGAALRLQAGGAGAAVRSQRELGVAAAGAGGAAAGSDPAAGARRQDRRAGGDEVSGAGGARQRRRIASAWRRLSPSITATTRQAGQLYAAWRKASGVVRQRILAEPELFFKTQRQTDSQPLPTLENAIWRWSSPSAAPTAAGRAGAGIDRPANGAVAAARSNAPTELLHELAERIEEQHRPC